MARRWKEIDPEARRKIERKILRGPKKYRSDTKEEQRRFAAYHTLNRLHWLAGQGCEFSFDMSKQTDRLRQFVPSWRIDDIEHAAASYDGGSGWVRTETDPSAIEHLPIGEIVDAAIQKSAREQPLLRNDPFQGLVAKRPVRALRALRYAYDKGSFHDNLWSTFLERDARKDDKIRFSCLIAYRLLALDEQHFISIIGSFCSWFETCGMAIRERDETLYEAIWERVIAAFSAGAVYVYQ